MAAACFSPSLPAGPACMLRTDHPHIYSPPLLTTAVLYHPSHRTVFDARTSGSSPSALRPTATNGMSPSSLAVMLMLSTPFASRFGPLDTHADLIHTRHEHRQCLLVMRLPEA